MTGNATYHGWGAVKGKWKPPISWYVVCTILLVATTAGFWFAYRDSSYQVTRSFQSRAGQQVQLAAQLVDTRIQHVFSRLSLAAQNPAIVEMDDVGRVELDHVFQESQPWVLIITRVSKDMRITYTVPYSESTGADLSQQLHNRRMVERPQPRVSSPFSTVQGIHGIAVMVPVYRNGEYDGCLSALIDHSQLIKEFVAPVNPGGIARMLVIDSNGTVISYPGLGRPMDYQTAFAKIPSLNDLAKALINNQVENGLIPNQGIFADERDTASVVVAAARTRFISQNNWYICALVPEKEIIESSPNARWPYLVALMYAIAVLFLTGALISLMQRYRRSLEREVDERTADLQASEERYRYLVDKMGEGIVVTGRDQRIIYANAALAEIFDTSAAKLVGKSLGDYVTEDGKSEFRAAEESIAAGHPKHGSYTITTEGGINRQIRYTGYPRFDDGGKYEGSFALVSDMTKQAQVEKTLNQERQLFTEGLVVTYKWTTGNDRKVDFISPNISQFGYSAGDFTSGRLEFWDIVHPDDLPRIKRASSDSDARDVSSFQLEYRIVLPGGDTRWVFDYTKVLRDSAGKPTHHLGYITDITRRKLAEEGLRQQQVELQAITRAFPDLYFRQDASGDFLDFITAGQEGTAQPLHFLGKEHIKMMPKHVVQKLNVALRTVITTQQLQSVEYSLQSGKQQQFFEARIVPMESNQVLGIIRNITERRRGEMVQEVLLDIAEAAAHTEDLHELLTEIHLQLGKLIDVTNFYVALYNEQEKHYEFPFFVDEQDRDFGPQKLPRSLTEYVRRTGEPLYVDRIKHKNLVDQGLVDVVGPVAPVWLGAPLKIAGRVIGVVAVQDYRDPRAFTPRDLELLSYVSEHLAISINRKRAEDALRVSEESYRRLVEVAKESIVTVDEREVITFANKAFCETLGYSREDLVGKSLLDVLSESSVREVLAGTEERRTGKTNTYEIHFLAAGGQQVDFLATATPLTDETGRFEGTLAVMVDITGRKAAAEAMLQTQKLESLGVMAGGIAHDFNNLLVGILGNAGLALNELPPSSPAHEYIQDLERASQRAADLTRQMLAYSGKGKLVTAPFDVSSVVREMSRLLKAVIPKSVVLELALEDDLPLVDGDIAQFRQVVMNLIINAAEAIGERSGYVNVTTGSEYLEAEKAQAMHKAETLVSGEYVFVEVADNGSGMEQAQLEKVFDPFYTTKFTGRGLGLAVVLGIVRSHKGAIQVQSKPGQGTSFKVLMPASPESVLRLEARDADLLDWRTSGTVLVVDDEPAIRTVTKRILSRIGMKAVLARDGKEGARMFGEMAKEIDLVILDLTMPRMSGEEALQQIRAIDPQAKVLLTSGYSEQDAVSRFADDTLAGFLQKPYTVADLVEKVRSIIENGHGSPD